MKVEGGDVWSDAGGDDKLWINFAWPNVISLTGFRMIALALEYPHYCTCRFSSQFYSPSVSVNSKLIIFGSNMQKACMYWYSLYSYVLLLLLLLLLLLGFIVHTWVQIMYVATAAVHSSPQIRGSWCSILENTTRDLPWNLICLKSCSKS